MINSPSLVSLPPVQMLPAPQRHALLLVGIHEQGWTPGHSRTLPTTLLHNVSIKFRAEFAMSFNADPDAIKSRQWACLMSRGGVFIWHNMPEESRPADPAGFPLTAVGPLMQFNAACVECSVRNQEILNVARVPKVWWIVVQDVASARAEAAAGYTK